MTSADPKVGKEGDGVGLGPEPSALWPLTGTPWSVSSPWPLPLPAHSCSPAVPQSPFCVPGDTSAFQVSAGAHRG